MRETGSWISWTLSTAPASPFANSHRRGHDIQPGQCRFRALEFENECQDAGCDQHHSHDANSDVLHKSITARPARRPSGSPVFRKCHCCGIRETPVPADISRRLERIVYARYVGGEATPGTQNTNTNSVNNNDADLVKGAQFDVGSGSTQKDWPAWEPIAILEANPGVASWTNSDGGPSRPGGRPPKLAPAVATPTGAAISPTTPTTERTAIRTSMTKTTTWTP